MSDITPEHAARRRAGRRAPRAARGARALRAADRPAAQRATTCSARSRSSRRSRTGASTRPTSRSPTRWPAGSATRCATTGCSATGSRWRTCSRPGLRPDASPVVPGCEIAAVYHPAGRGRRGRRRLLRRDRRAGGLDRRDGRRRRQGRARRRAQRRLARDAADGGAADRRPARGAGRAQPHAAPARDDEPVHRRRGRAPVRAARPGRGSCWPATRRRCSLRDGVGHAARPSRADARRGRGGATGRSTAVELAPDDVLVLYTDGVLDAVLPGGERFGEARLRALVERLGRRRRRARRGVRGRARAGCACATTSRCWRSAAPARPPLLARGTLERRRRARCWSSRSPAGPRAPGAARATRCPRRWSAPGSRRARWRTR